MRIRYPARIVALFLAPLALLHAQASSFHLKATPATVQWGHYDPSAKPVLRIHSGDTVEVDTVITDAPQRLERAGLPAAQVPQVLRDIHAQVHDRGPGPHLLTGPIYIEGAEPGDALEVRILGIEALVPFASNGFAPQQGFLPEDFPYVRTRIIPLDLARMVAKFSDKVEIPMRPFFGSMGVAPAAAVGRVDSIPPSVHGGNMDDKALVAGTTVFLPVWTSGALFQVGDGHAAQGNGEVDVTALETSLRGKFQFILHKHSTLRYPRAETPTSYIAMGFSPDLTEATRLAVRQMIAFLTAEKGLSRDDAYMLVSVAGDVEVTELVDSNRGVHVVIPKSLFLK